MSVPQALFYISVNGGPLQRGGIVVAGGSTIQFVPGNISGWEQAKYEIYGWPPGWPVPAGWTLDPNTHAIYSTDFTPALITLEPAATRWGKWLARNTVNDGVKFGQGIQFDPTGQPLASDVLDTGVNGFEVLSPVLGLSDIAIYESGQFGSYLEWVDGLQKSLRLLDVSGGGSGISQLTGDVLAGPGSGSQAATVVKVHGTSVNAGGGLTVGQVLRATAAAAAIWGALDLANGAAVTGDLPIANIAPGTSGQVLTTAGGPVTAWATIVDANVNAAAAIAGTKISPNFGSQAVSTTGTLAALSGTFTGLGGGGAGFATVSNAGLLGFTATLAAAGIAPGTAGQIFVTNASPTSAWTSLIQYETTHGRFQSGGSGSDYKVVIGPMPSQETSYATVYLLAQATAPGAGNYVLRTDGVAMFVNSPSASGQVYFRLGDSTYGAMTTTQWWFGNSNTAANAAEYFDTGATAVFHFGAMATSATVQYDDATSGVGKNLKIAAQKAFAGVGGMVVLQGGVGTTTDGGVQVPNFTTAAPVATAGGPVIFGDTGALKAVGTGGTIATLCPADPHCEVCGLDFANEWVSPVGYGRAPHAEEHHAVCLPCRADWESRVVGLLVRLAKANKIADAESLVEVKHLIHHRMAA